MRKAGNKSFEVSPIISTTKLMKQPYKAPQAFLEADKENCNPQFEIRNECEKTDTQMSNDLPGVITDMSYALEKSNNTVQNLKSQLETVLQRETTLQLEYDLLLQRYENLLHTKSHAEALSKEQGNKAASNLELAQKRVEEYQESLRQKNKLIEAKNGEIGDLTQKLRNVEAELEKETRNMGDEIEKLKRGSTESEQREMYFRIVE